MNSFFSIILACLLFVSCSKGKTTTVPEVNEYNATAQYVYIKQGMAQLDTTYATTFTTTEINDTMVVNYYWHTGNYVSETLTSKKIYGTDSVRYSSFHTAPQYILTVYPAQHKIVYLRIFDSRPAGDDFWDYHKVNGY